MSDYTGIIQEIVHEGLIKEKLNQLGNLIESVLRTVEDDILDNTGVKIDRYNRRFPKLQFSVKGITWGAHYYRSDGYAVEVKIKCENFFFKKIFRYQSTRTPSGQQKRKMSLHTHISEIEYSRLKVSDFDAIINDIEKNIYIKDGVLDVKI